MARKLIGLAEARRIAIESCTRFRSEQVPLEQALGRALADDVRSEVAIPRLGAPLEGFLRRALEDVALRALAAR
jgi:molybdopterin biosynthesis enzyme